MQLLDPFVERRLTRETLELVENVGRKGLPTARRPLLQRTMQSVGDVANLKHLRHAQSMYSIGFACKRSGHTSDVHAIPGRTGRLRGTVRPEPLEHRARRKDEGTCPVPPRPPRRQHDPAVGQPAEPLL